jgi:hypothetical protein
MAKICHARSPNQPQQLPRRRFIGNQRVAANAADGLLNTRFRPKPVKFQKRQNSTEWREPARQLG